jgi:hypothetical protein
MNAKQFRHASTLDKLCIIYEELFTIKNQLNKMDALTTTLLADEDSLESKVDSNFQRGERE